MRKQETKTPIAASTTSLHYKYTDVKGAPKFPMSESYGLLSQKEDGTLVAEFYRRDLAKGTAAEPIETLMLFSSKTVKSEDEGRRFLRARSAEHASLAQSKTATQGLSGLFKKKADLEDLSQYAVLETTSHKGQEVPVEQAAQGLGKKIADFIAPIMPS